MQDTLFTELKEWSYNGDLSGHPILRVKEKVSVLYSTLHHLPPLSLHIVSESAGIEPRTIATSVLAFSFRNLLSIG